MQQKYYQGLSPEGFHKLSYLEWGSSPQPLILCAHGLLRNAHDFDDFAEELQPFAHVVAPDIVGRGDSDWLSNPVHYNFAQYLSDMNALLARLKAERVIWIGTSMGGLIGMMLAAQPNSPITHLVLNDVGHMVSIRALEALSSYSKDVTRFETLEEVEQYYRSLFALWGPLEDHHWHHMAQHSVRKTPQGYFQPTYDPKIAMTLPKASPLLEKVSQTFMQHAKESPFWNPAFSSFLKYSSALDFSSFWNKVHIPTLILRGEHSTILTPQILEAMQRHHPHCTAVTIPQTGHAPSLSIKSHSRPIIQWLQQQGCL